MKRNLLTYGVYTLISTVLIVGSVRLYNHLTDDFRLSHIRYEKNFPNPQAVSPLSPEEKEQLAQMLKQKFSYIGKGAQCYAFASEDQRYVLKFFKFKHLKPSIFFEWLPSILPFQPYMKTAENRKKRKLREIFESYALTYKENKDDSALLYLQLSPADLNLAATVIDKIGLEREIDLDTVVFLIQKKGVTLKNRLDHLLKDNQLNAAKESLSAILSMYIREYQKGLYDRDHDVMQNTGFVQDIPFHLDAGKFSKDNRMRDSVFYKQDLIHVAWKIDSWLKANYPAHYPALSSHLADLYYKHTGDIFNPSLIDPKTFVKMKKQ